MAFLGPGWRQPTLTLRFLVVGSARRRADFVVVVAGVALAELVMSSSSLF